MFQSDETKDFQEDALPPPVGRCVQYTAEAHIPRNG